MKLNLYRSFILSLILTLTFSVHVTAESANTYEEPADESQAITENEEDGDEQNNQQTLAEEVNTENLNRSLNEALDLFETRNIDETQVAEALQAAIEEASNLLNDEESTQEELNAATERLEQAIQEAAATTEQPEIVEKGQLWKTIEEATTTLSTIDNEDATAYIEVLRDANIIFEDPDATQDQVDTAQVTLKQAIDEQSDSDGEREVEVIDDLITIVTEGSYDQSAASQMIENMQNMFPNLYQGLIDHGVKMYLINFPLTELEAFEHLTGVVPPGWEDTGNTWDDVPGAGGQNSAARIGYSSPGSGHGSLNLELHEIAHPIDSIVLDGISETEAFEAIHTEEQPRFLPAEYFKDPGEYFAEAFSYYFLSDEHRRELEEGAPKTYAFIENLSDENTVPPVTEEPLEPPSEENEEESKQEQEHNQDHNNTAENSVDVNKDKLHEAIEAAITVAEENKTDQLQEAINHAIMISENPETTADDVNKAVEMLTVATAESESSGSEGETGENEITPENNAVENTGWEAVRDRNESKKMTASSMVNGGFLPTTATNTGNYLLIGTLLILLGMILTFRRKA